MIIKLPQLCKTLVLAVFAVIGFSSASQVLAWNSTKGLTIVDREKTKLTFMEEITRPGSLSNNEPIARSLNSSIRPFRYVKNDKRGFRSKADVIREVKNRYNAKVLKITLNEKRNIYNVRILLPSGKIKSIQVSAR